MIDNLLEKFGLKYDDLNAAERETLHQWGASLTQNHLTTEKIKSYIGKMRDSVEQELTKTGHDSKQDIFLKARLRNYMLMEAFLTSPERAREAMEGLLQNIKPKSPQTPL